MSQPFPEESQSWQGPPAPPPADDQPASRSHPPSGGPRSVLRLIWAGAMLLLLIGVWVATSPQERPTASTSWSGVLITAESDYTANDARTSGAPQQQVVNGWYANDLANIHADQLSAQHAQSVHLGEIAERFTAVLAVVALTLIGEVALRAVPGRAVRPRG